MGHRDSQNRGTRQRRSDPAFDRSHGSRQEFAQALLAKGSLFADKPWFSGFLETKLAREALDLVCSDPPSVQEQDQFGRLLLTLDALRHHYARKGEPAKPEIVAAFRDLAERPKKALAYLRKAKSLLESDAFSTAYTLDELILKLENLENSRRALGISLAEHSRRIGLHPEFRATHGGATRNPVTGHFVRAIARYFPQGKGFAVMSRLICAIGPRISQENVRSIIRRGKT